MYILFELMKMEILSGLNHMVALSMILENLSNRLLMADLSLLEKPPVSGLRGQTYF